MYKQTTSWFLNSELKAQAGAFLNAANENRILEIGSYEGSSSVFFADTFLDHPNSRLTCVDPFLSIATNDHREFLQDHQESHFDFNISICKYPEKVTVHKITSDRFFETNASTYTFIYIDGCHLPDFITRDMEHSFSCLEKGGIMWMDDYMGGDGIQIKGAMDRVLKGYEGQYDVIHRGYQLAIRKI